MTAYWVVYVSESLASHMSKIDLYHYLPVDARGDPSIMNSHTLLDFIPGPVRMLVSDENQKLFNEIQDY